MFNGAITKDPNYRARKHLTELLSGHGPFSYLRLMDGELLYLLDGMPRRTGLHPCHRERLITAYQECSYLDLYMRTYTRENTAKLDLKPSGHTYVNSDTSTVNIMRSWTYYEFHDYIMQRRCLIAGAESALLSELYSNPEYRKLASGFWPDSCHVYFLQARENGTNLDRNLELIKDDIVEICQKNNVDTLFLSLGGCAKILCYEIALELGICTIDWGNLPRALAYSATAGQSTRTEYCPYFLRVPFDMYMQALEAAHPEMGMAELITRGHEQLKLELNRRKPMVGAKVFDPSPENMKDFHESLAIYKKRYRPKAWRSVKALRSVLNFQIWRITMTSCNGKAGRLYLTNIQSMKVRGQPAKKCLYKIRKLFR